MGSRFARVVAMAGILCFEASGAAEYVFQDLVGTGSVSHAAVDRAGNLYVAGVTGDGFPANGFGRQPSESNLWSFAGDVAQPVRGLAGHPVIDVVWNPRIRGKVVALVGNPLVTRSVYESDDGGTSWHRLQSDPNPRGYCYEVEDNRPAPGRLTVYCTNEILRLAEDGRSWSSTPGPVLALERFPWRRVQRHPLEASLVFASAGYFADTHGNRTPGCRISEDGGQTWRDLSRSGPLANCLGLAVDMHRKDAVYVIRGYPAVLAHTIDRGKTWTEKPLPFDGWRTYVFADGKIRDTIYAVRPWETGDGPWMYRSSDAGTTWTAVAAPGAANSVSWRPRAFRSDPGTGMLAVASDAGVYRSGDQGRTWQKAGEAPPGYTDRLFLAPAGTFSTLAPIWVTSGVNGYGFVAKYDETRRLLWANYLKGVVSISAMAVDELGGVYLGGGATRNLPVTLETWGPSTGITAETALRGFLSKIRPDGSAIEFSTFAPESTGIAVDDRGAIYLARYETPPGRVVASLSKLAPEAGRVEWTGYLPDDTRAFRPSVTWTRSGIYLTGGFVGRFDPGSPKPAWVSSFQGVTAAAADWNGNLLVAGMDESEAWVGKLLPGGGFQWRKTYTGVFPAAVYADEFTGLTAMWGLFGDGRQDRRDIGFTFGQTLLTRLTGDGSTRLWTAIPYVIAAANRHEGPPVLVTSGFSNDPHPLEAPIRMLTLRESERIAGVDAILNAATGEPSRIRAGGRIRIQGRDFDAASSVFFVAGDAELRGEVLEPGSSELVVEPPSGLPQEGFVELRIRSAGRVSNPILCRAGWAQPVGYPVPNGSGLLMAAHEDNSPNSALNPARTGTVVSIPLNGVDPAGGAKVSIFLGGYLGIPEVSLTRDEFPGLPGRVPVLRFQVPPGIVRLPGNKFTVSVVMESPVLVHTEERLPTNPYIFLEP